MRRHGRSAQMFGRSCAPALAMGNAVVLKPADEACLAPILIAQMARKVGFPAGAINVVTGLGHRAGDALAAHPGVDFLSFTGSPAVGVLIQTAAARNHIGCTPELSGKSPQIVFADADPDAAVPVLVNAVVQDGGPDAPLVARGQFSPTVLPQGDFVAPALFGPVAEDHVLARKEVFGPVLCCIPFADEADALRIANGTDNGLVASVWTRDGGRQMRMAKRLRGGQVFLNCYGAGGGVELPFGGVRKSGHGREKGLAALYEFSQIKTMVQNHG